jgi:hypothetical protein
MSDEIKQIKLEWREALKQQKRREREERQQRLREEKEEREQTRLWVWAGMRRNYVNVRPFSSLLLLP